MPKAKQFKRWVTSDILPSIRKHGAYITRDKLEEVMNDPEAWIKMLTTLKEEREQKEQLKAELIEATPKVVFADAVAASDSTILIGELANIIRQNGVPIGEKRLFEFLRHKGFLIKRKGSDYNSPTQKSLEMGLLKLKESVVAHPDGHIIISKTTKVTGKGQQYFINKFLKTSVAV